MLYSWSIDQAQQSANELETRTDPLVCADVGLSVKGACQNFRSLELNVTNTNNQEIAGVVIWLIGLYPDEDSLDSNILRQKIAPGTTDKIIIMKKKTLSQIKVVPFAKKDNKNIICEEKSITKDIDDLKQC
ncbi:MAG: hypothetical protein ABIJ34_03780 [archaeon]